MLIWTRLFQTKRPSICWAQKLTFYVQGMEDQPEKIVNLIMAYYLEQPKYSGLKEFQEFKRFDKETTNVSDYSLVQ